MFSARKRCGKKELPQWKRDLEGASDEEPPPKRTADPVEPRSADADAPAAGSSSAPHVEPAPPTDELAAAANDDDDDDDDNFDPNNYELGGDDEPEDEEGEPPWAQRSSGAAGVLPAQIAEYSGGPKKGARYLDVDGRDTICFHRRGASNETCQSLVGSLPGYRATRFVKEMVFVLFSDHSYAVLAMESLNKESLLDEHGKASQIRSEWAKRSLRPY
ncbi:hypothetical protein AB1Y20_013287 [Prymnesium parvum]|uniref:Uncharacterized protein n=1 Tax=Prymnesium parvum TaxID=97485 RepID=A0AB34INT2_PRYPA|mmetsp:Transcript_9391/g.14158  ORF Transcript_9391/g.14158 Transcript_9391/m.14158 type:complete len:217 (+) Transcript_9391:1-651(+)